MKAMEVLDFVGKQLGMQPDTFPDGGFISGSPEDPVKGIAVTWMATADALRWAGGRGLNMVICHEWPFYVEKPQGPMYRWTSPPEEQPYEQDNHPNQVRRKVLRNEHLTLLHIHYGLDRLCIYDDFANAVDLGPCIAGDGYEKVHRLPRPMTVRELARIVADKVNFPQVRIVGNPERIVTRAGNLWGGVGMSGNRYWMRKQIEYGAEVIVCGEANEDAMFFALEYGAALIVTSHVVSENIGLRHFTALLQERFPRIPSEFYEVKVPFSDHR